MSSHIRNTTTSSTNLPDTVQQTIAASESLRRLILPNHVKEGSVNVLSECTLLEHISRRRIKVRKELTLKQGSFTSPKIVKAFPIVKDEVNSKLILGSSRRLICNRRTNNYSAIWSPTRLTSVEVKKCPYVKIIAETEN